MTPTQLLLQRPQVPTGGQDQLAVRCCSVLRFEPGLLLFGADQCRAVQNGMSEVKCTSQVRHHFVDLHRPVDSARIC
jgi:hypothetical protein